MEKKNYESGMWSERDGSKLAWGKGDQKNVKVFAPADKIENVPSGYHAAIRKAGKTPEMFCSVGSTIAARTLIPEIEACIDFSRKQKDEEKAAEQAELDNAIASGLAFRAVEIARAYGCELTWAQPRGDRTDYAEWVLFGFAASRKIKVEERAVRQVIGPRKADGSFPGCNNQVYRISAEEWDLIISVSTEMQTKKAAARQRFETENAADIQHKIESGYCFYCESYCHGDCGHYTSNPDINFRRDLKRAQNEAAYGINEG